MKKILSILAFACSANVFAAECATQIKNDDACAIKVFVPILHCKNSGENIVIPVTTLDIKNKTALENSIIAECNAYFKTTNDTRNVPAAYDAESIIVFKLIK